MSKKALIENIVECEQCPYIGQESTDRDCFHPSVISNNKDSVGCEGKEVGEYGTLPDWCPLEDM